MAMHLPKVNLVYVLVQLDLYSGDALVMKQGFVNTQTRGRLDAQ